MIIAAALELASLAAPFLGKLIAGPTGARVAETVVKVASEIAGVSNPADALAELRANPAMLVRYQVAIQPVLLAEMEAETARLEQINQTMRVEATSGDAFVRRWRPTFGYVTALTWLLQFLALGWSMVAAPQYAAELINAITALTPLWGIALAVLGVNVWKRSGDKAVAAGQPPGPGLLSALSKRLGGDP